MARTHLLQAVCTVALLAAGPALAQRPEAGMTNSSGQPNPMAQQNAQNSTMTPADNTGTGAPGSMEGRATHRSAMTRSMRGGPNAQDAAVDRLNDQSYQAAQQGQTWSANGASEFRHVDRPERVQRDHWRRDVVTEQCGAWQRAWRCIGRHRIQVIQTEAASFHAALPAV